MYYLMLAAPVGLTLIAWYLETLTLIGCEAILDHEHYEPVKRVQVRGNERYHAWLAEHGAIWSKRPIGSSEFCERWEQARHG